jgi:hypothetical protein
MGVIILRGSPSYNFGVTAIWIYTSQQAALYILNILIR